MAFPGEPEMTQASLWLAVDRQRVRDRFRATLAGLLELEVLRARHRARVDRALGWERTSVDNAGEMEGASKNYPTGSHLYPVPGCSGSLRAMRSHSQGAVSKSGGPREIWAWPGWAPEDFPQTHRQCGRFTPPDAKLGANLSQANSKSRASSGFCDGDFCADDDGEDTDGRSLSGSRFSLDGRPLLIKIEASSDGSGCDSRAIPASGLLSVASLCPESHWWHFSTVLRAQVSLEPRYCLDLTAEQSRDVYRFPSPLHAVALQSPLYASSTQSPATAPGGAVVQNLIPIPRAAPPPPSRRAAAPPAP